MLNIVKYMSKAWLLHCDVCFVSDLTNEVEVKVNLLSLDESISKVESLLSDLSSYHLHNFYMQRTSLTSVKE